MLKSEIYTEEVTAEAEVTEDEAKENGAVTQYEVFNTYSKYMLWVPFIMLFNLHENNLALDHVALVSSDISYVHINNQVVDAFIHVFEHYKLADASKREKYHLI